LKEKRIALPFSVKVTFEVRGGGGDLQGDRGERKEGCRSNFQIKRNGFSHDCRKVAGASEQNYINQSKLICGWSDTRQRTWGNGPWHTRNEKNKTKASGGMGNGMGPTKPENATGRRVNQKVWAAVGSARVQDKESASRRKASLGGG